MGYHRAQAAGGGQGDGFRQGIAVDAGDAAQLQVAENQLGQGRRGGCAGDIAEQGQTAILPQAAQGCGPQGRAYGINDGAGAGVIGHCHYDGGQVGAGAVIGIVIGIVVQFYDQGCAEVFQQGRFGGGSGDGDDLGAAHCGQLDGVGAQSAAGAGDYYPLAGGYPGGVDAVEGHADGAGQQGRFGRRDGVGDWQQGSDGQGYELGKAAVAGVSDAGAVGAAVLASGAAAGAVSAGGGEQADGAVAGLPAGYIVGCGWGYGYDGAGDFVAQGYAGDDAPPQGAGHHQQVVVAEAGGVHPQQRLAGGGNGNGAFRHCQRGGAAGLEYRQGAHRSGYGGGYGYGGRGGGNAGRNWRNGFGHSSYGGGDFLRYWRGSVSDRAVWPANRRSAREGFRLAPE